MARQGRGSGFFETDISSEVSVDCFGTACDKPRGRDRAVLEQSVK